MGWVPKEWERVSRGKICRKKDGMSNVHCPISNTGVHAVYVSSGKADKGMQWL